MYSKDTDNLLIMLIGGIHNPDKLLTVRTGVRSL
jgi:hypothetical protein